MIDVRHTRLVSLLQAVGLGDVVAALLETGNPLPFLGAQALYFAAPVVDPLLQALGLDESGTPAQGLAAWLEDPAARQALVRELTETRGAHRPEAD